jgi:two-component system chemotaxis response regulator CheB
MIRVLVVDDSTFMRTSLVSLLEEDPEIKVAGTAVDGQDALKKAVALEPDVITLDVEMPRMDGLATLQELMKIYPVPVLMASALTEDGAQSTFKALEYGALDFIPKTMSNDRNVFGEELRHKVKAISRKKSLVRLK